ncbi:hypothetical protein EV424DRAFT_1494692 [Suillus variegatus]|nr:hypothetical protein EV424DRAFT_1494692 [Suillus variegatus]
MSVEYINFLCETRDTRNALPTSPRTVCPFIRVAIHVVCFVTHLCSACCLSLLQKRLYFCMINLSQVGGVV